MEMKTFIPFFLIVLASIHPLQLTAQQIITVKGAIEPEEMGTVLIHEHIMVDWIGADSTGYHRWDRSEVVRRVLPYLEEVKKHGVTTFLDCTPAFLGRDPYVLRELSDKTGIHILTNTGYYGSGNNKYVPKYALEASPEELAQSWIKEYINGIDDSGIRPGFMKISVENEDGLSEIHEKLVRAAALAHLETGMTIVSHTGGDGPAMAQLKVLKALGVSPSAFVWTHAQNGTMDGYLQATKQGAWISIDNVKDRISDNPGTPGSMEWYVKTLSELRTHGILDHILISHDAGWYDIGEKNGGGFRGYTEIFTTLIPRLKKNGFTQKDIDQILRENPKRAYMIHVRKL